MRVTIGDSVLVRVTVGDSGLCFCVYMTYFEHKVTPSFVCCFLPSIGSDNQGGCFGSKGWFSASSRLLQVPGESLPQCPQHGHAVRHTQHAVSAVAGKDGLHSASLPLLISCQTVPADYLRGTIVQAVQHEEDICPLLERVTGLFPGMYVGCNHSHTHTQV